MAHLDDVDELHATGKSLVPDGFEQKLDTAAMADLLAFLRAPRRELLANPAAPPAAQPQRFLPKTRKNRPQNSR